MNSLILILFLGATVALAEIHVENDPPHKAPRPILKKCKEKCMKPTKPGELADEENDPRVHRGNRHPSLPPKVRKCIHDCLKEHKPSKPPPPHTESGKVADEENDPRRARFSGPLMDDDCIPRKVLCSASYPELLALCQ
ncbi:uncharacterized protein LOC110065982 [Orbicella faveolata]|uniref:uncharacterized protein LOC110065982 n=1 Tax=Orbicella faveolata TaxID=48498 RepID=UPI0009E2FC7A|nr:uncharacterized protein LOC110065982 [Orbicella faveolata]